MITNFKIFFISFNRYRYKQNPHDIGVSSYNRNNEYYTPKWVWEKVYNFLPYDIHTVWEPFFGRQECLNDMRDAFREIDVICKAGKDFFKGSDNPPEDDYNCIITNPAFTEKNKLFRRLKFLGKPFVVLLHANSTAAKYITENFQEQDLQHIALGYVKFLDKNVKEMPKADPSNCVLLCWKMNIDESLFPKKPKVYQINELRPFCKKHGMAVYGSKAKILERIYRKGYTDEDIENFLVERDST